MKYSTVILFIAVFGLAASKWTGADEMCKDSGEEKKEESAVEASATEEAKKEDITCKDWAGVYFMMKGMVHFHTTVCGTSMDAEMDTLMDDLDNMKPSGCEECDMMWGDMKGCPKAAGSASASAEASAATRVLLAEKFGIAEEMNSVEQYRFLADCKEEADAKPMFVWADLPAEQQDAMRAPLCALDHMNGSMMGAVLSRCKSNFEGQSDWTADHETEYNADRKAMEAKCVEMGCKDVMGESCDAAMTAAGMAATWADITSSGSNAYIMSLSMLIAIIMMVFRY